MILSRFFVRVLFRFHGVRILFVCVCFAAVSICVESVFVCRSFCWYFLLWGRPAEQKCEGLNGWQLIAASESSRRAAVNAARAAGSVRSARWACSDRAPGVRNPGRNCAHGVQGRRSVHQLPLDAVTNQRNYEVCEIFFPSLAYAGAWAV